MNFFKLTEEYCKAASAIEAACLDTAWSEAQIREAAESDAYVYLTAIENDRLCAVASACFAAGEAYLVNIAVTEAHRRRGIAEALLRLVEKEAGKRGCSVIILEVAEKNKAAISLYEKNGFVKAGLRKGLYGSEDGVVMRKAFHINFASY